MKTNQTNNQTALFNLDYIKSHRTAPQAITASASKTASTPNTDTKQTTTQALESLMQERNDLIKALENTALVKPLLDSTIHTLCETIAQISVYKTLSKLADSPVNGQEGASEKCLEMYRSFTFDMLTYKHNDTTATYSDAFDLFNIAYLQVWEYLHTTAPLTLTDTVRTDTLKNGNEKNYTIFQTACKSIRDYIRAWSKSDEYKKLHYIIGIADNGAQVTTSKRPQDTLQDIDESTKTAFFVKYGLTAQQQEIFALLINGENASTIATLLNIPLRTVQDNIKKGKAKFATANAYAEYITATNAEKLAKAKAEKNTTDSTYQKIWISAQERTAQALKNWRAEFAKGGAR